MTSEQHCAVLGDTYTDGKLVALKIVIRIFTFRSII